MRALFLAILAALPFMFFAQEKPVTSVEIPEDGVERTPREIHAEAFYLLGEQNMDAGYDEKALKYLTAAQTFGYSSADLYYRKGRIYEKLGARDSACVYFRRAGDLGDEEAKAFVRVRCK